MGFYSSLGVALLGTVCDGDCGIDVACQMVSLPQTAGQRALLREEPLDRNYTVSMTHGCLTQRARTSAFYLHTPGWLLTSSEPR